MQDKCAWILAIFSYVQDKYAIILAIFNYLNCVNKLMKYVGFVYSLEKGL